MTENEKLIIIGASGHGKVIADIAECLGYEDIAFLDDDESLARCMEIPVIGTSKEARKFTDASFIVAIGNAAIRERLQNEVSASGLRIATLVHPKATISSSAMIGEGTVIMAGAVVNPDSVIGKGCIINTGATVDHDNRIDDFAHISVGSHLAGTVSIGKGTWVGAGAVVSNNICICADCIIGAGAVVVKDISRSGTYVGVPARLIGDKEMKNSVGGVFPLTHNIFQVADTYVNVYRRTVA